MKKIGIILFGLLVLISLKVEAVANHQSDSIQFLIREYKYHAALALINKEIAADQSSKELYLLKGKVLRGIYAYESSIQSFLKALSLDSTNNQTIIETASTFKLIPDYENALNYFSKALRNDTSNVLLQIECANCKFLNEQYRQSNTDFLKIYLEDTLNYYVIRKLGIGFSKVNQIDTSIFFFEKAVRINPTDASNITNLCNLLITKDKFQIAIDLTENFRLIDSTNSKVNSVNAYLYLLNKQYAKAIEKFENCIALKDTSRFILKNLGISYFKESRYDTAKYWLEKAYFMDTTDVNNLQFLGISCSQSYYKKLGIFYLEKAVELYEPMQKEYASIYRNLVEAYRAWSPTPCEKNLEVSLKAYGLNPKDSLLALFIGIGYDECKQDYRKAIEYYKIYLQSKPPVKEQNKLISATYTSIESRVKVLRDYLKKKI